VRELTFTLALLTATSAAAQEAAITFDDLPAHSALPPGVTRADVARDILRALKGARVRSAHGFVNGVQLEREPDSAAVLDLWRAASHPLGNHTWSHPNLDRVGPAAFIADAQRNEALLADERPWFRYPFLSEGAEPAARAQVRHWLSARGYRIASVTLSFDDWAFNDPYARCVAKGDDVAIAELERQYLAWAKASLDHSRGLARAVHGPDTPLVLLMHVGAFDARMLPRLLDQYRKAGVRFVSLDTVMRHPFYQADYEARPSDQPTTLEAEATRRGLPVPAKAWSAEALNGVCR
jgi:peptidoglycan/xylan/chitin deacetylase (PgdA/CDA1 family)